MTKIFVFRGLLLKEEDPCKWNALVRMMDHNEEHSKDKEEWQGVRSTGTDQETLDYRGCIPFLLCMEDREDKERE